MANLLWDHKIYKPQILFPEKSCRNVWNLIKLFLNEINLTESDQTAFIFLNVKIALAFTQTESCLGCINSFSHRHETICTLKDSPKAFELRHIIHNLLKKCA